ncbi:hypothetical protein D1831_06640 [Lactiplantibacillus garii]|uniref:Uncharacterized protein n=1 Tax=Lactiplantibacillus garii TaxID=2306423 RepID=A0A3R8J7I6_9LACO|nr:hypothetical protein [Lactiplantibacillus garii]RRK10631.1 hypothetical protein D1831_06640 [Lactiplantibacillus garii]
MKQQIVPALPTERVQYEQWYQLGLAAMTATTIRLRRLAHQREDGLVGWLPQFTVRCSAPNADQRLTDVQRAVAQLAVAPTSVLVTTEWVEATFTFVGTPGKAAVWNATDGALWRLYDGLLTSLVGTEFQPLTQIRVGLTRGNGLTPQVVRPSFAAYAAPTTNLTVMATPPELSQYAPTAKPEQGGKLVPFKPF